jgi:alpha-glucosidase
MANPAWWQSAVIYQIYPRSFQDSSGDGIGDLPGIFRRLDYLVELGVDAIWISPIFPSPMQDFGYDISDYTAIDPLFGTMEDFEALLAEAHRNKLKLILDLVPNHTSDQHPWFVESRSSRTNPKRDWYIWHDPGTGGGPPNNWLSEFGGSAWEWDARSGQYYYHAFLPEQPDLNWRNRKVREAMHQVMRFWLARGGRWIPRRRHLASHQGRPVQRQSAQSRLRRGHAAAPEAPASLFGGPARCARSHQRTAPCHRRM